MIMQCAYSVDPQYTVKLQWFKMDGTTHVPIWTADTSGRNAAEPHLYYLYPASEYPLSNGHAIRIYYYGSYYCTISITTSLGEDYHAKSNVAHIAQTGKSMFYKIFKLIL